MSWLDVKLGDVCKITSGGTPSRTKNEYWGGDFAWVKISDMLQGEITWTEESITSAGLDNSSARLLPAGTLLLSIFATVGRTAILAIEAATNQAIVGIEVIDDSRLDKFYLKHCLEQKAEDLKKRSRGVAQANINISILKDLVIPLPPLAQQQRIATILNKAAEIKAKREQAIAKLDALISSTFTELFLKDDKWPTLKLMEVCTTTSGGTPKRDVANYYGGEIFWVKSGELAADLVMNTEETLTFEGVKNSSAKVMPPKTVLLAMYGATIGAVSMLGISAATNQAVCCITVGEKLLPEFLVYYLKSIKHNLIKLAVGGAQPNINQDIIRNLLVPIPPASLQQMFLERAAAIRQQIIKTEMSLSQIKTAITSLQHQAFTTGFN